MLKTRSSYHTPVPQPRFRETRQLIQPHTERSAHRGPEFPSLRRFEERVSPLPDPDKDRGLLIRSNEQRAACLCVKENSQ
jgi:hypothetical protein